MIKSKNKINNGMLIFLGIAWFLFVSLITAQTEYQRFLADKLADPKGTSTQLESLLNIFIVVVSFMPSGILLTYSYVLKNFKDHRIAYSLGMSFIIATGLFMIFSWYNFSVNFAR